MGISSLLSTTLDCVSSLGWQKEDSHHCSAQRAAPSGGQWWRARAALSRSLSLHWCYSPKAQGSRQAQVQHCRGCRALFAVLFKGQIPEQQLHPWSPEVPQPPDSWVPSAVTAHINLPLTVTTGDKAHKTDSDSFPPLFPLWFSFTATAVCLRWPGMKKTSPFMMKYVGPGEALTLQRTEQMAKSSLCSYWQSTAQHHPQQSQLYQTHTQALALPDTKLTPRKQII